MKKILLAALCLIMCQTYIQAQTRTTYFSLPLWIPYRDTLRTGSPTDTSTANIGINSLGLRIDKHLKIIRDSMLLKAYYSEVLKNADSTRIRNYSNSLYRPLSTAVPVSGGGTGSLSFSDGELLYYSSDDNQILSSGSTVSDFATSSHNHTLDGLSNVLTTGKSAGNVLKWNGTNWADSTDDGGGGVGDSARVAYRSIVADIGEFRFTGIGGDYFFPYVQDDGYVGQLSLNGGKKRFLATDGGSQTNWNIVRARPPLDTTWQDGTLPASPDTLTISADTSILATKYFTGATYRPLSTAVPIAGGGTGNNSFVDQEVLIYSSDDNQILSSGSTLAEVLSDSARVASYADSLRQRDATRYFKAGTGSTTNRYKAFDFSTIAGYPLLQIVSDSLSAGGLTRDIGDAYYQGGAVKVLDDLSIEDETYLDEGLSFSYYDFVSDTLSFKYANTQWTKYLVVTAVPSWLMSGNSIELGTVQDNNLLRRRITSVSNDTVYVEPYLNYVYPAGTQIKISRARAHIYPRAASPYKPGGTLTMGFPQTTMESDSFKQTIDVAPLARFSTPLANNYSSYVISGGTVRATSPASMSVTVDSGSALYQGKLESGQDVAQLFVAPYQTVTHGAADATNPRIDAVCWDSVGVVKIIAGTAAASPTPPSTPTRFTLLAYDTITAGATSLATGYISDRRDGDMNINPVGSDISFNSTAAPYVTAAGRGVLTMEGSSAGVFEAAGTPADAADNLTGHLQFIYPGYASGSQRLATVAGGLDGATAGARGGNIRFYTKANNATSFAERARINSSGYLGIGDASPAAMLTVGSGDLFQVNSSGQIPKIANVTMEGKYGVPGVVDTINRVGYTESVGTTNFAVMTAGVYEVGGYIEITTGDAETITLTLSWTDAVGATTSTPINLASMVSTGRVRFTTVEPISVASGNFTWATTVTTADAGVPVYNVKLWVKNIW